MKYAAISSAAPTTPPPMAATIVYSVYPLDPLPATSMDAVVALVLGIAGVVVQLFITANGKKRRK